MKVLMITCRADVGGGPEHVRILAQQILNRGGEVFISCPKEEPYFYIYNKMIGATRICEIPHRRFSVLSLIKTFLFIQKKGVRIVHSHGKGAGLYSRLLKLISPKLTVVHTFHGVHVKSYGSITLRIYQGYEHLFARLTSLIIAVSNSESEKIKSLLGVKNAKKVRTIENGIELEKYQNPQESSQSVFRILMTSRFDYQKNTKEAIEIFEKYCSISGRKSELTILGDGEERNSIKTYIKSSNIENINLPGNVSDVAKYLSTSIMYLNTSRWEGLSIGAIEALAVGLPIVASAVEGNTDIVVDGMNGYLYTLGDVNFAAEAINKISSSPLLLSEMRKNAIAIAKSRYSATVMGEKTFEAYATK